MLKSLMRHRNRFSKYLAKKCASLIRNYENLNYDFDQNGERILLKKLSTLNFTTVFDVGGNVGQYSVMLRKYFPDAEIHIFEIIQDNIHHIENKMKGQSHVFINNFGLSNENDSVKVKCYGEGSEVSSIYDYPHKGESNWIDCPVKKGDSYVSEKSIKTIDYLKIDTEGNEPLVLEGLYENLKNGNIRVIQFEYGRVNIITKYLLRDFYQFFSDLGYVVGKLYPKKVEFKNYELDDENFFGPNFIAVKKNETEIIRLLSNEQRT